MSRSSHTRRFSFRPERCFEQLEDRMVLAGDIVSIRAADGVSTEGGTWAGMDGGFFTRDGIVWTVNGFRADNAVVVFERSGAAPFAPLEVHFTVEGTATGGADYPALTGPSTSFGVANFAAGSRTARLVINPYDDLIAESTETLTLTLSAGPDYTVHTTRRSATITILDDEPVVTISAKDARASERSRADDGGSFLVSRSGKDLLRALDVDLLIGGSATSGDDYPALPERVTIPAGQKSVLIPVTVIDDTRAEVLETLTVSLPPSDSYHLGRIKERSASVTILDNEPVVFVTADKSASEGAAAPVDGSFHFTRLATEVSRPLVAHYTVAAESTATAGVDYETLGGEVTFAAGQKSATVLVHPFVDGINEVTETVIVTLDASEEYMLAAASYRTAAVKLNNYRRVDFLAASAFDAPHRWDYSIRASARANDQSASLTALMHARLDRAGALATWSFAITDASDPSINLDLPSITFRETDDGVFLKTLTTDSQFDLGLDSMRVSPSFLSGTLTDSSPFDLSLDGVRFTGTATLKTALGKLAAVTVPAGTFSADQLSMTLRLGGRATSDRGAANFSLTLSMTMLTVPGIGPVRIIEELSASASSPDARISLSAKVTAELLHFD